MKHINIKYNKFLSFIHLNLNTMREKKNLFWMSLFVLYWMKMLDAERVALKDSASSSSPGSGPGSVSGSGSGSGSTFGSSSDGSAVGQLKSQLLERFRPIPSKPTKKMDK